MVDMPPDAVRQWNELKGLAGYFKSVSGALTAILTMLPLGGLMYEQLVAPEVNAISPAVAVMFCLIAIPFHFYAFRGRPESLIYKWAIAFFGIAVVSLGVYIWFLLALTFGVDEKRHLTGFWLTSEALDATRQSDGPTRTVRDLLNHFGHESDERIWGPRTLEKYILVLSCSIGFMSLVSGFFLFTLKSYAHDMNT